MLDFITQTSLSYLDKFLLVLSILIPILVFVFIIFIIIAAIQSLRFKPKCEVCKKIQPDILSQGKQKWFLCRNHLLTKYADLFKKNIYNCVVVEFTNDSRLKNGDLTYAYYPTSDIKGYIFEDTHEVLQKLLESIKTKNCIKCDYKAYVLFIHRLDAVWRKENLQYNPYEYIVPSREYLTKGNYLCNDHAIDAIKPGLQNYPEPITVDGGVWLPYKEDGFQAVALV